MKNKNPPLEGDEFEGLELSPADRRMFAWAWNGGKKRSPREWYERYGMWRGPMDNKNKGVNGTVPSSVEVVPPEGKLEKV
jgi:hypothetical protein